jgi:hypothetical protein
MHIDTVCGYLLCESRHFGSTGATTALLLPVLRAPALLSAYNKV